MVLSFVLMFGVQMFYYAESFKGAVPNIGFAFGGGIAIGLFTQLVRLSFGLAGAYDFAEGKYGKGAGGLLFSFCVTLFEAFEVQDIAQRWGNGNDHLEDSLLLLFQFLLWCGFALEIRLAMNLSSGGSIGKQSSKEQKNTSEKEKNISEKEKDFSSNGTAKSNGRSRSKKV